MADIRLIVCDIDGTLIGRDEKLPADASSFVEGLRDRGVEFTLASGRVETDTIRFAKELGVKIPFVATNGAVIADSEGHPLMVKKIAAKSARAIMEKAHRHGLAVIYTVDGTEYVFDKSAPYIAFTHGRFDRPGAERMIKDEEYETLMLDKVSIMAHEDKDNVISELEAMCVGHEDEYMYTRYQARSVELVEKSATKASAVEKLVEMLGYGMENVLFCGDHQNDIELLRAAAIGCAPANATENAKMNADYVSPYEIFEGVRDAVRKYIG